MPLFLSSMLLLLFPPWSLMIVLLFVCNEFLCIWNHLNQLNTNKIQLSMQKSISKKIMRCKIQCICCVCVCDHNISIYPFMPLYVWNCAFVMSSNLRHFPHKHSRISNMLKSRYIYSPRFHPRPYFFSFLFISFDIPLYLALWH